LLGVLPQQVDDAHGRLTVAPVRLDEQVQLVAPSELLQDLVHRHHVAVADRTPRVVPVRDERCAEHRFELSDEMLRLVEQHRRLLDTRFHGW